MEIPVHPYRTLIIGRSWSRKTDSFFNLIGYWPDIDKIYLYAKHPYQTKYQFFINDSQKTGLKHLNDSKAFIEYQMKWVMLIMILKNTIQKMKRKKLIFCW